MEYAHVHEEYVTRAAAHLDNVDTKLSQPFLEAFTRF